MFSKSKERRGQRWTCRPKHAGPITLLLALAGLAMPTLSHAQVDAPVARLPESSPYHFEAIALTGDITSGLTTQPTGFSTASINDDGLVAYLCANPSGGTLCAGHIRADANRVARLEFSSRLFQGGIQLSNDGALLATDRASGPVFFLQKWDAPRLGVLLEDVASGRFLPTTDTTYFNYDYDGVFGFATMNNDGDVAFIAQGKHRGRLGSLCIDATCLVTDGLLGFNEVPIVSPARPMISDDEQIVVRYQATTTAPPLMATGPISIRVFDFGLDLANSEIVAETGWSNLGMSPGISDTGEVVAFSGNHGQGQAIYAAIGPKGSRDLVFIAGSGASPPQLGYADLENTQPINFAQDALVAQRDTRVGVLHRELGAPGLDGDEIVLTFLAQPTSRSNANNFIPAREFSSTLGLWTVRIDVVVVNGVAQFKRHMPLPVIQLGQAAPEVFGDSFGTITAISLHDPIAVGRTPDIANLPQGLTAQTLAALDVGRHELGFIVTSSSGNSAVVRATYSNSCLSITQRRYSQGQAPWGTDVLDHSPSSNSISAAGCVLTTMAMQLDNVYRQKSAAGGTTNPQGVHDLFCSFMPEAPGYLCGNADLLPNQLRPFNQTADLIRDNAVAIFLDQLLPGSGIQWTPTPQSQRDTDLNYVYETICTEKLPLAVRVRRNPADTSPGHDVLITGITHGKLVLADPAGNCGNACAPRRLARTMDAYANEFQSQGFVRDPDDLSYLILTTSNDSEVLATDSIGRRAGFLRSGGGLQVYTEIPNSTVDEVSNNNLEDEFAPVPPATRTVRILQPGTGTLAVTATGARTGPFELLVSSTNAAGAATSLNTRLVNYSVPNSSSTFSINVGTGGGSITIVSTPVPSVIGKTLTQARASLVDAGLREGAITTESHPTVPAGSIISQMPAAGTAVAGGSVVELIVSSGTSPTSVGVPNVVGLSQAAASSAITTAGLVVETITQQSSSTVPLGNVISQNPSAGASVATGSAVSLVVSTGPAPVTAPNVVGLSQAAASSAITTAGLVVGTITQQFSSTVALGSVISQNPVGGASVAAGSVVNLVVSSGPATVTVPNVVGLTQAAASSAITTAGFVVGTITQQSSATVPLGNVISQNPSGGTNVTAGSAVNLVVSSGPALVTVPNVVGQTQAAASSAITSAGLVVGAITQQSSSTVPLGNVISQSPAGGASVASGSAVNLVVSSGAELVTVPNVVGLAQTSATSAIVNAGLVVGTITQQSSSTVPSGNVISQSPSAGVSVAAGSAVNLVVSNGPAPVTVPNVVGQTQAAASSAITSAGLVIGTITQQSSSTVPLGNVISQNPSAGANVAAGSSVSLVVSSGPAPVTVPNVVGQTQAAASSAITAAGLVVGTITQQSSATAPSGTVISQNPSGGMSVTAGSAVNLVVSSGPAPVMVPNVVGQTQAAASSAITNAGLVLGTVSQQSSATVAKGNVISQNPNAGASVAAGSAVNLVVSSGPASATVPNVVGQTQAAASSAITNSGLVLGTVTQQSSSAVPKGNVISQNPNAGVSVAAGSAVNLVVSSGAESAPAFNALRDATRATRITGRGTKETLLAYVGSAQWFYAHKRPFVALQVIESYERLVRFASGRTISKSDARNLLAIAEEVEQQIRAALPRH